jgi:hypothetical protein
LLGQVAPVPKRRVEIPPGDEVRAGRGREPLCRRPVAEAGAPTVPLVSGYGDAAVGAHRLRRSILIRLERVVLVDVRTRPEDVGAKPRDVDVAAAFTTGEPARLTQVNLDGRLVEPVNSVHSVRELDAAAHESRPLRTCLLQRREVGAPGNELSLGEPPPAARALPSRRRRWQGRTSDFRRTRSPSA